VALLFLTGGVANVLTGPRAGRLSDTIGRKRVIVAASVGLGLTVLAVPWMVRSVAWAYLFFFLVMVLFAARIGPLQALLTQLVPAARRGSLMSLTVGTGQLGFALGSMLAGIIYATAGFAASTTVAAAFLLATAWIVWRYLPEPGVDARA
jgi:predicted MFS family arabinose efflux permease